MSESLKLFPPLIQNDGLSARCGDQVNALLYVADATTGGIADYSRHQIEALLTQNIAVTVLCRPDYPGISSLPAECVLAELPSRITSPAKQSRWRRGLTYVQQARQIARKTAEVTERLKLRHVLFDCFREYFAPLWVGHLRRLARRGVVIGVIAHDPVRDFIVGPQWWHQASIRAAYSPVRHVFVHDKAAIDFGGTKPKRLEVHQIPHGHFNVPPSTKGRSVMREIFGFTSTDRVFLSFGQIRDGKNLDKFLNAMAELPEEVKLLVAGSGGAESQQPPLYYQKLAARLGVSDRCRWEVRYIPTIEIANFFECCDCVLLLYSNAFRSASGVLNQAAQFNVPIIGSSGEGPLKSTILEYRLGTWVMPDCVDAIRDGIQRFLVEGNHCEWERYKLENSWHRNAMIVAKSLGISK
jgi:glycosyltransferase involved in cell wall biosynthesis